MCGRYFFSLESRELAGILQAVGPFAGGEIFPTNEAPILSLDDGEVGAALVHWGFPGFSGKGVVINARSETAEEKRMFRGCLDSQRCVVPSTGFFEWTQTGEKQKYLFREPGADALYMAGLYGDFSGGRRFVILTTAANPSIADVHGRMPLVLPREAVRPWLSATDAARALLHDTPPLLMRERA